MTTLIHKIVLTSNQHFGGKLPPRQVGLFLAEIPGAVQSAVSMALRNRGNLRGCPAWLKRAGDMRFVDHQGNGESVLIFEAPPLGAAAHELFEQGELWQSRPDAADSGFDLLGDVLGDVGSENADSDRFVPSPRRIRLTGTLDMVRGSNQTFGLKTDEGEEVRGVLLGGSIEELARHLNKRVLVLGKAVYRPSGLILRLDTDQFRLATEQDDFFSRLPEPPRLKLDIKAILRDQQHKKGVRGIFGRWPGDETDEEIEQAMKELS